jgi:phospholipid/cholesterol/gamma-HCH transport system substrate-binding protein
MNNKVNYTWVGAIVLFIITGLFIFVVWLAGPSEGEHYTRYRIYFDESVAGLNVNSPVKYRGVNVGQVLHIGISHKKFNEIEVLIAVKSDTPVNTSTRATLNIQGITGLVFVNLSLGNSQAPPLVLAKGEHVKTIQAAPSLFNRVEKSLTTVTARVSDSLDNINKLLNPQNIANFSKLLSQTQQLMQRTNALLDEKTVKNIHAIVQNVDQFSKKLNDTMPHVNTLILKADHFTDTVSTSLASIVHSYKVVQASASSFQKVIQSGQLNIKDISKRSLDNLNVSLDLMQENLLRLDDVLKQYQQNPGGVLFETRKAQKGPGEK